MANYKIAFTRKGAPQALDIYQSLTKLSVGPGERPLVNDEQFRLSITNNQKAIIIGSSSGIGKELAKILSSNGYDVGLCARRLALIEDIKSKTVTEQFKTV